MRCYFRKIDQFGFPFYEKEISEEQLADLQANSNIEVHYKSGYGGLVGYADLKPKAPETQEEDVGNARNARERQSTQVSPR